MARPSRPAATLAALASICVIALVVLPSVVSARPTLLEGKCSPACKDGQVCTKSGGDTFVCKCKDPKQFVTAADTCADNPCYPNPCGDHSVCEYNEVSTPSWSVTAMCSCKKNFIQTIWGDDGTDIGCTLDANSKDDPVFEPFVTEEEEDDVKDKKPKKDKKDKKDKDDKDGDEKRKTRK